VRFTKKEIKEMLVRLDKADYHNDLAIKKAALKRYKKAKKKK
jgi:hypothetical protein